MGRGRIRVVLIVLAVSVLLGAAGYVAAGTLVYDGLSKVHHGCGSWTDATGVTHPRFSAVTPADLAYSAADFGPQDLAASLVLGMDLTPYRMPDYQDVSFPSRSEPDQVGVTIRGWWVPGPTSDAPAVVLIHGRDSCRKDWNVMLPAGMLHRAGFAVLTIDLRNQGASDLTSDSTRGRYLGGLVEYADVLGAWDWLRTAQGLPVGRIGLFGTSLGAGAALLAAAAEPQVAAVWEDSSWADTEQRVAEEINQRYGALFTFIAPAGAIVGRLQTGLDLYARSPLSAVTELAGRALAIVHGAADPATQPHHAQDLYAAATAAGVQVEAPWIVPYAGHTWEVLVARAEYEQRLAAFFGAHLGTGPSS